MRQENLLNSTFMRSVTHIIHQKEIPSHTQRCCSFINVSSYPRLAYFLFLPCVLPFTYSGTFFVFYFLLRFLVVKCPNIIYVYDYSCRIYRMSLGPFKTISSGLFGLDYDDWRGLLNHYLDGADNDFVKIVPNSQLFNFVNFCSAPSHMLYNIQKNPLKSV